MVHEGENTSYTIVLPPASIDRVFLHYPGCNATFTVDDLDESALSHTKIMHFGYPLLMKALYTNRGEQLVRL